MHRKMTITQRLILISLVVSLPLVAITVFLVVTSVNKDINFGRWEVMGNAYQRPLEQLLDLLPQHGSLSRIEKSDPTRISRRQEIAARIDAAFTALAQAQEKYGVALQFTAEGLKQRKREHVMPANVRGEWTELTSHLANLPATDLSERHAHLVADVRTMITHAGDTSNLILDPDLDSYYLMDVTLLALPQNQDRLATMDAYAAEVGSNVPTPAQQAQFAVFAALLKESDVDRINGDVQTALNEDANFNGVSASLQSKIPTALKVYNDALAKLLERVTKAGSATETFDAAAFQIAVAEARAASFSLWNGAADELDGLLAARIKNYERSRTISLGLTALAMIGAALVVFMAIRSLKRALDAVTLTLGEGADRVASTATQVAASNQTLAEGASAQAASLQETSAALEEVSSMTKNNADSATQARELAAQTRAAADTGAADMEEMKAAMNGIATSSTGISKIIKTIDEIAFQTNILALNAAVEAARAGEAGMGFAVVADEVRSLAQRSAQSAKETAEKIEEAIQRSEDGVKISSKVAHSLAEIVEKARKVDALIAEIANASTEQNEGISQVNIAVRQMDQTVQDNAANADQTAAAADALGRESEATRKNLAELLALVGRAKADIKGESGSPVSEVAPKPRESNARRVARVPESRAEKLSVS